MHHNTNANTTALDAIRGEGHVTDVPFKTWTERSYKKVWVTDTSGEALSQAPDLHGGPCRTAHLALRYTEYITMEYHSKRDDSIVNVDSKS